jgi:hypothetical protein
MYRNRRFTNNGIKIFFVLFISCSIINASILCKYESLEDSSGNRLSIGCDNGQLKSITVQGKDVWDNWTF